MDENNFINDHGRSPGPNTEIIIGNLNDSKAMSGIIKPANEM